MVYRRAICLQTYHGLVQGAGYFNGTPDKLWVEDCGWDVLSYRIACVLVYTYRERVLLMGEPHASRCKTVSSLGPLVCRHRLPRVVRPRTTRRDSPSLRRRSDKVDDFSAAGGEGWRLRVVVDVFVVSMTNRPNQWAHQQWSWSGFCFMCS